MTWETKSVFQIHLDAKQKLGLLGRPASYRTSHCATVGLNRIRRPKHSGRWHGLKTEAQLHKSRVLALHTEPTGSQFGSKMFALCGFF